MKPVWDQALPSGSGGETADQMQKMMCAANIMKNQAYVKARSLIAALYSLQFRGQDSKDRRGSRAHVPVTKRVAAHCSRRNK